jgi:hypothetical protein
MNDPTDRDDPLEWSVIVSVIGVLLIALLFAGAARMLRSEREGVAAAQARAPARVAATAAASEAPVRFVDRALPR